MIWNLLLQADSEGPTLISCTAPHFLIYFKSVFVAHNRQAVCKVQGLMALGQKVGAIVWKLAVYTHLTPSKGLYKC